MTLIEVLPTVWVSDRASLDTSIFWGRNIRIFGAARISAGTVVGDGVTIGYPSPEEFNSAKALLSLSSGPHLSLDLLDEYVVHPTVIGSDSIIRGPTTIYSGVTIGADFDCGHNVTIRERCRFGDGCYIKVNTEFRKETTVGDRATLAGTIGDRSVIGDDVTSFGSLIHKYDKVRRGVEETGPRLRDGVFVGRGATVIGPVTVGESAYIAAGAIVTKDVAAGSLVKGHAAHAHEHCSPGLEPIEVAGER